MARGEGPRRRRVWIDENGVKQFTNGRPSASEQKAKEAGRHLGLEDEPNGSVISSEPKQEPTLRVEKSEKPDFSTPEIVPVDIEAFKMAAQKVIEGLNECVEISNHPEEKKYLGYFAKIIEEQMLPKYLKPHISH